MMSKGHLHNAARADIDGQKVDAVSSIGLVWFRVPNQGRQIKGNIYNLHICTNT